MAKRTSILEVLGRRIRTNRRIAGFSQRETAERADVDFKYFGCVERGQKNITLETLSRIAVVLGVQPYQLLPGLWDAVRAGHVTLQRHRLLGGATQSRSAPHHPVGPVRADHGARRVRALFRTDHDCVGQA